jgi:hypothetical protein
MSEVLNHSLTQQEYNIHHGDRLLDEVDRVICVLLPRGLVSAGYSDRGDLLMIRYADYKKELPTWIIDFYEHQFINEDILALTNKVHSVFIATDKSILIPDALYQESEAKYWLSKIHFVETNDIVSDYALKDDKAHYLYAWPSDVQNLVNRYFPSAKLMPFSVYQFYKPYQSQCFLQTCITMNQVYATLYNNNKLQWHQVFQYENAEDIAYHIQLLCKEYNISPLQLNFQSTIICRSLTFVQQQLNQFFPNMKDGSGNVATTDKSWTGTIYLLQLLYSCAL